ncbi:conserved hypothetical protein [Vibrio chagasii]|nr:conserved hypothetical protein [Vibrio chagasii]CAH6877155.1 conserved hypothetical protein [Vibrio chagasii]CAH6878684.1 conserved hypothetical protein [Vibrio chagasii]CAH7162377.1 conserved hypothetical protein [Vibrio chagasii]CAH7177348.1 conserved hypothetical protein [Vibrio chagasii]
MSLPDQPKATASSGGWFDSILEGAGELVGGAVDVVGNFSSDMLDIKMDNELERAKSASPDENRANNNDYQQPNGQPVNTKSGIQWQTIVIVVVLLLVVFGGLAFVFKGSK